MRCAVIICFTISVSSYSQLRHVEGIKSLGINVGFTGSGSFVNIEATNLFTGKLYGKAAIGTDFGKSNNIKYSSLFLDIGAAYTAFDISEKVFINGLAGLTASTDKITNIEGPLAESVFKYGAFLGAEIEFFLSNKSILLLNGNQRFMGKDEFGNTRYFFGIGYKFIL